MTAKYVATPESLEAGRKFNAIRLASKMTQDKFGSTIGVKKSSICAIEKGTRNPSDAVVELMKIRLNISPKWWDKGEGPIFRDAEDAQRRVDQAEESAAKLAERDKRIKAEARAEMEKEKQNPETDHLKVLFAKIRIVLPDSSSLIEKNDIVGKLLHALQES